MTKTPQALAAEYKRLNQQYSLDYNGGGHAILTGSDRLCIMLGIAYSTLLVQLSIHKGVLTRLMKNPITEEPDILTITRLEIPKAPRFGPPLPEPKPRGRPRTRTYQHELEEGVHVTPRRKPRRKRLGFVSSKAKPNRHGRDEA